jgi:23S rRNA (guanosine2251-2'-O)-methyltransferase
MKNKPHFRDRKSEPDKESAQRNNRHRAEPPKSNIIYGALPVLEALRASSRKIDKIMIAEGIRESRFGEIVELARKSGVLVNHCGKDVLTKIVGIGVNHQGVIAIAAAAVYVDVDEILDSVDDDTLIVVLDGIEDPQNLGAILRVAECSGSDGVIIPERRAVGLTETVAKASAGAIEYVKVAKVPNLNRLIADLKQRDVWIVGTSGDACMSYTDWDWNRPTALVLGGEGHGLHRLVAENCDVLVKIPMYGKIESLNVSVATGVVLFEAKRRRAEGSKQ